MGGRSVLVTGGGRRIGRTICAALQARGWNVLVHTRDAADPLGVDLAADGAAERLFAAAVSAAPGLCAIVNNAAAFATARELPADAAARLLRVNAEVPCALTELLARHLAGTGRYGSVVNLLDTRVLGGRTAVTPYEVSKRTLLDATREQARRLAPGVRVNGVAPGPVLAPEGAADREKGGEILLARRPTSADVAAAVAYFLEAESVTGQVLAVDAGQSLMR